MSIARGLVVAAFTLTVAAPVPAALIQYGDATIVAGEVGQIGVWLRTDGEEIVATQNDIQFPSGIHGFDASDHPLGCHVNSELHKDLAYRLLTGGSESGGETLRAIVISFSNFGAIADGTLLYTCDVQVRPTTQPGTYPLRAYQTEASDPYGRAIRMRAVSGSIHVLARHAVGEALPAPGALVKPLHEKHAQTKSLARFVEKMVERGRATRPAHIELGNRSAPGAAAAQVERDRRCLPLATPTPTPVRQP